MNSTDIEILSVTKPFMRDVSKITVQTILTYIAASIVIGWNWHVLPNSRRAVRLHSLVSDLALTGLSLILSLPCDWSRELL